MKNPIAAIAREFDVSRHLIYKAIQEYQIEYKKFTSESQPEIETAVVASKQQHANAGEAIIQGHLSSMGVHVQRHKIRREIHAVDPEGVEEKKNKKQLKEEFTLYHAQTT